MSGQPLRVPTVEEYAAMHARARRATYRLVATIAAQAEETEDIWTGAEAVRQRAIGRWHDTPRACRARLRAAHAEATTPRHHRGASA